jgi:hypothetical protein
MILLRTRLWLRQTVHPHKACMRMQALLYIISILIKQNMQAKYCP